MSKQYWNTKQLHIELKSSPLTVVMLTLIHLFILMSLAFSLIAPWLAALVICVVVTSYYFSLNRFGLLLSPQSVVTLEFSQQRWRQKLRGESAYQPIEVIGRLMFGGVLLHIRVRERLGDSFLLLTGRQLSEQQLRVLRGLLVSR